MGYGEFDGGGSMGWVIEHGNKTSPSSGKGGAAGGDGKDHEATVGKPLAICFNGSIVWSITCYNDMPKLYVLWGNEKRCPPSERVTGRKTAGRRRSARKATAKKS